MDTPVPVARLVGVGYDYGRRRAVNDLSLDIGPGVTGLLGLNGVGKTTVLRMLATVTRPSRGRVEVFGIDTSGPKVLPARRRLGYVPQDPSWNGSLRVREFLELFAWMRHTSPDRVDEVLDRTQLHPLADRRLGTLSGGEHRRAMVAQALLADPGLLVLDEPTAGLDPQQRRDLRTLLGEVSRETATVISTHLLEDVATIADTLVVLDAGTLVFRGTPRELAGVGADGDANATALEAGFLRVIGAGGGVG